MRIFVGCVEICGLVTLYANELKRQGHQVTTCANTKHRFFPDHHYDLLSDRWADYVLGRDTDVPFGTPNSLLNQAALKLRVTTPLFDGLVTKRIFAEHDVFIFIWAGWYLMRHGKDLEVLKKMGKKVVSICVGSDVRYPQAFEQEFGLPVKDWPAVYQQPFAHYLRLLRQVELHSDLIYSLPDQAGLAIRPYDHFPIPLELDQYSFHYPDRDVPVIVHAPSAPAIKGTDVILGVFDRLRSEGIAFDLRFIQNMPNKELRALLRDSDLLVDELILHGPGILSVEGMLTGNAVATRYYGGSPGFFRPPVCPIDHDNLYDVVKRMIVDKEFRRERAYAGRAWAEQHNDVGRITSGILTQLQEGATACPYQPLFFRDHFVLPKGETASNTDKRLTRAVAEKWMPDFAQHKKSLEARGLI
ncbi:hypothetical protein [Flaviaesturariibacter amylovorans]|uniref:Glycosyltransferase family 1 protein n=1 Tax=Flaviaesturariibacter amylovorans TaxID=1084520 RepID=A0ABP8GBV0_9BACT